MAQTSGFFEAEWDEELYNEETQSLGDWDRKYLAEEFARYFKYFVPNGVMNDPINQLKVTAGTGMKVIVSSGFAFINGYWFYNSEQLELDVPLNETPSARADSVRIRWNAIYRTIECIYVVNDIANVRSDTYYDLQLAQVTVGASASIISDANITDVRDNKELCGLINIILADDIGDIEDLTTTNKESVVGSINEIYNNTGLSLLNDLKDHFNVQFWDINIRNLADAIDLVGGIVNDITEIGSKNILTKRLPNIINGLLWNTICEKPFDRVDAVNFIIETSQSEYYMHPEDGRVYYKTLKIKAVPWSAITGKEFDVVSSADFVIETSQDQIKTLKFRLFHTLNTNDFTVSDGELKISDTVKMFNAIDAETLSIETLGTVKKLVVNHAKDDFVISNRQFVFSNLQCRINDDRITANSLADVYFNSESINYAQKAKISVETYSGYLILTALVEPTGSIYGTIRIRVV